MAATVDQIYHPSRLSLMSVTELSAVSTVYQSRTFCQLVALTTRSFKILRIAGGPPKSFLLLKRGQRPVRYLIPTH